MHDYGPLTPPKEGGVFAELIGCVNEAKNSSDGLLTEVIEAEKKARVGKDTGGKRDKDFAGGVRGEKAGNAAKKTKVGGRAL